MREISPTNRDNKSISLSALNESPRFGEQSAAAEVRIEPPPHSRMECRQIGSQWMLLIPPGRSRRARNLGLFGAVFAAAGTGFLWLCGSTLLREHDNSLFFACLVPLVFLAIGLTMIYFAIRSRFGWTQVLIEPGRLVMRLAFCGRDTLKEYAWSEGCFALLGVAYCENDEVVDRVEVYTDNGWVKFGTFLDNNEKQWVVDQINTQLGYVPGDDEEDQESEDDDANT